MKPTICLLLVILVALAGAPTVLLAEEADKAGRTAYEVHPVGWVRKDDSGTRLVIDEAYLPAMQGLESLSSIWVLYWFDRNDNPEDRAILQVYPRGNPDNPCAVFS